MSVLETIGILLPLGVAGAFSSVPVAVVIAILLSRRSRPNGVAYLIGWAGGAFLVTLALTVSLGYLPPSTREPHSPVFAGIEIALGILLIIYGIIVRRRAARESVPKTRRWLEALHTAPIWIALSTGIVLNFRPKALILGIAAALTIANSQLPGGQDLAAVGIYTIITASSVAGPVIFSLLNPSRAQAWLATARRFVTDHGNALTLIVSILIGVALIGNGLTRL